MARHLLWAVTALLLIPVPGRAAGLCERDQAAQQRGAQPPAGHGTGDKGHDQQKPKFWWMDPQDRAELGITDQQSAAIELVWQKAVPSQRERRERLDKLEEALSQMIRDAAEESVVIAQMDRVEGVRTELNKGRMLMLYRMNRLLTPDQRVKLDAKVKAMHARDGGRRESSSR
jgi:Spy/CpxP family protein refolding chaperone